VEALPENLDWRGEVLPLEQAVLAHRMLEGAPHKPGKTVLRVAT